MTFNNNVSADKKTWLAERAIVAAMSRAASILRSSTKPGLLRMALPASRARGQGRGERCRRPKSVHKRVDVPIISADLASP